MTTPENQRSVTTPPHDAETEIAAIAVGSGILLTQSFALFPGLLPCLVLVLPLVLPLVVLGAVAAVLIGVPLGIWRLIGKVAEPLRSRSADVGQLIEPGRTA